MAKRRSATRNRKNRETAKKSTQTVRNGTQALAEGSTGIGPQPEPGCPTVDVVALPANRALVYWPHARKWIIPAFEHFPGEISEREVLENLSGGTWMLWVAWSDVCVGGAVTCIYNYADFKAIQIIALGADRFEGWRAEMDRLLDKFATIHDCRRVEFYGRKGWENRLDNYKLHRIMMVREI